jgi:hypothetical protein
MSCFLRRPAVQSNRVVLNNQQRVQRHLFVGWFALGAASPRLLTAQAITFISFSICNCGAHPSDQWSSQRSVAGGGAPAIDLPSSGPCHLDPLIRALQATTVTAVVPPGPHHVGHRAASRGATAAACGYCPSSDPPATIAAPLPAQQRLARACLLPCSALGSWRRRHRARSRTTLFHCHP